MTAPAPGRIASNAWVVVVALGVVAASAGALLGGSVAATVIVVVAQLTALGCLAWRVRTWPPRPVLPWAVLIAGILLQAVMDGIGAIGGATTRWEADSPLLALGYVAGYTLMAGGFWLGARAWGFRHDLGEIVDAAIVMASAGIAAFALVLGIHVDETAATTSAAAVTVVVIDTAMLGLGALVLIRYGRATGAIALMAGALVAQVITDTLLADNIFGYMALPATFAVATSTLGSALLAAAMLHPSVTDLMRVRPNAPRLPPTVRLAVITGAAIVACVAAFVGQIVGEDDAVDTATDMLVLVVVALVAFRAWMLARDMARAERALARTTTELAERSAFVAGVSEAVPGIVFAGDLETLTIDDANRGWLTTLGVDPASVIGKPGWIVRRIHPDDLPMFASTSESAMSGRILTLGGKYRTLHEDGSYRTLALGIRFVADDAGTPRRFVGVGIDVTEQVEAESALAEARRFAEEIVATSPGMVFRGRFSPPVVDYASPGVEEMLGFRPDEVVGIDRWFTAHLHPDDVAPHVDGLTEAVARGGDMVTRAIRIRAASGDYRWILYTARVAVDPDGAASYIASAIDITAQRETEERLRERDVFITDVVRTSPAIIFAGHGGSDLTVDFVSPSVERVLGYAPEEIVGVPGFLLDHVHPDDAEVWREQRRAMASGGAPDVHTVRRILGKDGAYRSLVFATHVAVEPDGEPRFVASAMDISDRIRLEDDLVAARDFVEGLVATSPGVIFRGRLVPRVVDYMSPGAKAILGYEPEEIVGVDDWIRLHMHPDDVVEHAAMIVGLVEQGGGEATAIRRICAKDGEYRALLVTLRLRLDAATGGGAYFASAIDVTERVRAEEEVRAARDAAEAANRAKSEFLSLISHDLRTPLNSILGFGGLLENADLSPEDRESVNYIVRGGRSLLAMVDRILDFARLETGRLRLSLDPIVVSDVVRQATEIVRATAADRDLSVEDRSRELGVELRGDGQRLVSILADVLDNSARYGGKGVHVVIDAEDLGHGTGRIVVRDDGVGMDEERLRLVLTPFEASGAGGTALGLSLGRRLIERMGGTLDVDSHVGSGTTVTITLPVWSDDAMPAPPGDEARAEMQR